MDGKKVWRGKEVFIWEQRHDKVTEVIPFLDDTHFNTSFFIENIYYGCNDFSLTINDLDIDVGS